MATAGGASTDVSTVIAVEAAIGQNNVRENA